MFYFDPMYFVFLAPAFLLMMWAQWRVKSTYANGDQIPANLSGAAAARHILDAAGLQHVAIEETHGKLTDHYDPRDKVLRLSSGVYHNRTASAVGIAAHEAGHALQDAQQYAPLVIRNAAVPAATFGGGMAAILASIGLVITFMSQGPIGPIILILGILGYCAVLFFQVINLPVEFDASARAKRLVNEMGIVDSEGGAAVRSVLDAAAWTYIAGTLQTLMIILYYLFRLANARSR
ncbi:zinc metallopeptidase [Calycomorphotria hydatis]|uniref:Neutral zinc metallopeptidase n=1 Tax=Calycomorphotria hydatis TaxID=2528027 RepID=A0A517TBU2_9PLAN|nr:zinc metallopeptidase [Calycomorphotria hydatis]QDT65838.1 Putative neutral zinc metallopeptidase [Calycomorphotria hydatis]